jgi:hypothetical protein
LSDANEPEIVVGVMVMTVTCFSSKSVFDIEKGVTLVEK